MILKTTDPWHNRTPYIHADKLFNNQVMINPIEWCARSPRSRPSNNIASWVITSQGAVITILQRALFKYSNIVVSSCFDVIMLMTNTSSMREDRLICENECNLAGLVAIVIDAHNQVQNTVSLSGQTRETQNSQYHVFEFLCCIYRSCLTMQQHHQTKRLNYR